MFQVLTQLIVCLNRKGIINYETNHTLYFVFSFERVLRKYTQEKGILLIFIQVISLKNVYSSCQRQENHNHSIYRNVRKNRM
jgi:hypothetical protein